MAGVLQFDEEASRNLEAMYTAPEVVAQRRAVLETLRVRPGEHVLDIGCGPGFLTADLAQAAGPSGRVAGLDISASALALARRRCAAYSCVEFGTGDATRLPFPNETFDLAVATQVYEYVADLSTALSELARVLRPGGRALVIDTDWSTLVWHTLDDARMSRILKAWAEHLVDPVLPRTLGVKLRQAGLDVREQCVIPYLNAEFHSHTYSNGLAKLIASFVPGRQGIAKAEVDAWTEELRSLGESGAYFFSLNRYLFMALKS